MWVYFIKKCTFSITKFVLKMKIVYLCIPKNKIIACF